MVELDTPYELLVRVSIASVEGDLGVPEFAVIETVIVKVLQAGWPLPRLPQEGDALRNWLDFEVSDPALCGRLKEGQYLRVRIEAEPNGERMAQPYVEDAGSLRC